MADEKKPHLYSYGWDVGVEPDRTVHITTTPERIRPREIYLYAVETQRRREMAYEAAYERLVERVMSPPVVMIPAPQYNRDVLAEALQYVIDNTNSQAQLDRAKAELAKVEGK